MRLGELQAFVLESIKHKAEDAFRGKEVTLICEDRLDFDSEVQRALSVAGGVAIVIGTPSAVRNGEALSRISLLCNVSIMALEVVQLNRCDDGRHITALAAAQEAALALDDNIFQNNSIRQEADESSGVLTARVDAQVSITLD